MCNSGDSCFRLFIYGLGMEMGNIYVIYIGVKFIEDLIVLSFLNYIYGKWILENICNNHIENMLMRLEGGIISK